jgi:hypothetical protein
LPGCGGLLQLTNIFQSLRKSISLMIRAALISNLAVTHERTR